MIRRALLVLAACCMTAHAQNAPSVYAAGSLRAPLTEAARAFDPAGAPLALVFGASGLLRDRIIGGEPAQVFASANMDHPRALAAAGGWTPVRTFTRNGLCALARPEVGLTPANFVARLLDPGLRLGTSTPRADPSGDYAFEMFRKIGARPGGAANVQQALEAKALQLTGSPNSPPPPVGRSVYGELVASGQADVFITYCTNAVVARSEHPQLHSLPVPAEFDVRADYGLTVRAGADARAAAFAEFLLSPAGQAILARHGFLPVSP